MAIELTIVTPEGPIFDGPVESVVLPGAEGEFGVLPEHARFLAPLKIGELSITRAGGSKLYAAVSGGFANVDGNHLVMLADTCELDASIDVARAKRAQERAEKRLRELSQQEAERDQFLAQQAALHRAIIRIQVAERS